MSTNPNPIQAVEQDILEDAVTVVEEINKEVPTLTAISHEQIALLAYQLWEASGAMQDSPLTLNFWLLAESQLLAALPETYNG